MTYTMTPTAHEKREWSRMAMDAYATGRNFDGHRYSAWAALPSNASVSLAVYDCLMLNYRRWLVSGWSAT